VRNGIRECEEAYPCQTGVTGMNMEVRLSKHMISKHLGMPYPFAVDYVSGYIGYGCDL